MQPSFCYPTRRDNAHLTLFLIECTTYKKKKRAYSSLPRKDVSLHAACRCRGSEEDFLGCWSSRGLQPPGAAGGVGTRSESSDVRSVLRSNDNQEESEETKELASTFSFRNPSPRSMATETWMETGSRETLQKLDCGTESRYVFALISSASKEFWRERRRDKSEETPDTRFKKETPIWMRGREKKTTWGTRKRKPDVERPEGVMER